jgi:hypothetical protein
MSRLPLAAASVCLLLWASALAAQDRSAADLSQAKRFFTAGASAYEMGDYAAAIQALDAAYQLTPLPAVAFSLAQAERRQYFVSRERVHLTRAMELYRTYLAAVQTGGRRADATDALAQLEPLAALNAGEDADRSATATEKTRLMISSATPHASISLDGATGVRAPLIASVTPGMHQVIVRAEGHFQVERSVEAVSGAFIPVEIALVAQPAHLSLRARPDADLHIDDAFIGRIDGSRSLELPSGVHVFTFAENGHELQRVAAQLAPGEFREIAVDLEQTTQRTAAITLFVAGGGGLVVAAVLTGLALEREEAAIKIQRQREQGNISASMLAEYDEAKTDRNRFRGVATTAFAASLGGIVTGLFLYLLDAPDLRAPVPAQRPPVRVDLPVPGSPAASVHGHIRF